VSIFTDYSFFQRVEGRTYTVHPAHMLNWEIGRKSPRLPGVKDRWVLYFWPQDTADVTVPWYAEPLVWLGVVNPHDPDLIAAAFVHDKLLKEGYDKRFAAAEFRRAYAARIERAVKSGRKRPSARLTIAPYYWGVYFHTVGKAGH